MYRRIRKSRGAAACLIFALAVPICVYVINLRPIIDVNTMQARIGNGIVSSHAMQHKGNTVLINTTAHPTWKIVSFPGCEDLLLLSAYFDSRYSPPRVAVIAGVEWKCGLTVSCLLKASNDNDYPLISDVQVYLNPEGMATIQGNRRFNDKLEPICSFLLECIIPASHSTYEFTSVSLILNQSPQTLVDYDQQVMRQIPSTNSTVITDSVVIQYPKHLTSPHQFTVCQQVSRHLYGKFKFDIHQLIEYIETSVIFGASLFVFYDQSITRLAEQILQHYQDESLVQLKNFRIPDYISNKIRCWGLQLILMDCFYDHMWDSEYIVHIDQDERLVPMKNLPNWDEMIQLIKLHVDPNFSSLNFKNVFILRDSSDVKEIFPRNHNVGLIESPVKDRPMFITSIGYTQRFTKDYPHGQRSKYIADPRRVMLPGVHFVHAEFNSTRQNHSTWVPADIGQTFHYRVLDKVVGAVGPEQRQDETRMLQFKPMIVEKIKERLEKLAAANLWT